MYPINLVYEIPIDENDYIRINIDLTVNKNKSFPSDKVEKILENIFKEIKRQFKAI